MDTKQAQWLTAAEFCALARIDRKTTGNLLNSGGLPGAVRVGRQWRIPADVLDRIASGGRRDRKAGQP